MPYIFKLVECIDEINAKYFASIEGLSYAVLDRFMEYAEKKQLSYEKEAVLNVFSPDSIMKKLTEATTENNKYYVSLVRRGGFSLSVARLRLIY